jgi:membrane-anchored glycerophosphoryl diester phosphodiesterase (GDPDase)
MTLTAGYFIFCHNLIQGTAQFSQFFDGFNRFIQILLYGIILFLFAIPFFILFFQTVIPLEYFREIASGGWNPEYIGEEILYFMEDSLGILFIMLVGFLYLYISYTFVLPLIVINKLDFWAAMETSRKWIAKNFGYWILFYLVLFVFIAAGSAISCGLGIFILFPYLYCCLYVAYQDLPVTQENEQNN